MHEFSAQRPESAAYLLENAGMTSRDLQPFDELRREGFSIFLHGSIIVGEFGEGSDLDFSIIGDLSKIPTSFKEKFLPEVGNEILQRVDYVSIAAIAENGRKLSMHIKTPEFRLNYPDMNKPYSLEYRPENHTKNGARSYLLPGIDSNKNVYLYNLICPQELSTGGKINYIPQVGILRILGVTATPKMTPSILYGAEHFATLDMKTGSPITDGLDKEVDIILLGLEFHKMMSETSFMNSDVDKYAIKPIRRAIRVIGEFMDAADPIGDVMSAVRLHSKFRVSTRIIDMRGRFIDSLGARLRRMSVS